MNHMKAFKQDLLYDDTLDSRMFAARVLEEAWKWMEDKSPAIFLFYTSLYSPRVALTGETEKEVVLMDALDRAVADMQATYKHPIVVRNFFPHISDMSFVAMSDDMDAIEAVKTNNPAWETKLSVNYEVSRLLILDHMEWMGIKKLERMEMTYSFEVVPNLTNRVIQFVLGQE